MVCVTKLPPNLSLVADSSIARLPMAPDRAEYVRQQVEHYLAALPQRAS
jgi:hypothetical protein